MHDKIVFDQYIQGVGPEKAPLPSAENGDPASATRFRSFHDIADGLEVLLELLPTRWVVGQHLLDRGDLGFENTRPSHWLAGNDGEIGVAANQQAVAPELVEQWLNRRK